MYEDHSSRRERRVVVTGIGAITPIGIGVDGLRAGLRSGRSAVRLVTDFDTSATETHIAAFVEDFDPLPYLEGKKVKRLDKFSKFAVAAAKMAVTDAGLDLSLEAEDRMGVCLGTALGGVGFAEEQYPRFLSHGPRGVNPMLALSVFNGAGSCNIAIELGLSGPVTANGDSCAAAPIAIGNAVEFIRAGQADVMLSGGCEAPLSPLCFASYSIVGAMSRRNEDPAAASRPFDADRDGFVIAEGAAILVLEEYEHARNRRARIYGEVLGHASTYGANPSRDTGWDSLQMARCMRDCLRAGGVAPRDVGYINAHAVGSRMGDAAEAEAIGQAFGDAARTAPVSSTKGFHGHALGASGAWYAAICLLSLCDDWLPPTLNLVQADSECELNHIGEPSGRETRAVTALSNSFSAGGINACLLFGRV